MPRNAEVIRQWQILRTLEGSRHGESVAGLARQCEVTPRTIWRDLVALQQAGFPLIDEKLDGRTRWKLMPQALKGLENSGLSLSELASLYFSRAMVQCLVGTPFQKTPQRPWRKSRPRSRSGCGPSSTSCRPC